MHKIAPMLKLSLYLAAFTWATVAKAQNAAPVRSGNVEVGAFIGESYGLDRFRPMFGGNVAYGLTRALYPFFEASYLPGLKRTFDVGNGSTTPYSIDLTDVHGGLHIRFPIGGSRIVPYAVAGLGLVRSSANVTQLYSATQTGVQIPIGQYTIPSNTSFAVNVGGGFRFFIRERIGIRVEFKAFVPTSSPTGVSRDLIYRFAIGPVFQIR